MFEPNRYHRVYFELIRKAKAAVRKKGQGVYYEMHHILPKCIVPDFANLRLHPENGVLLTAREHFIAHRLLCKFTLGEARTKCLRAYHAVCYKTRREGATPTSLQYRKAREAHVEATKGKTRGSKVPTWSLCNNLYEFEQLLTELVKEGETDNSIAKRYSVSAAAVSMWRYKLNIERRRPKLKDRVWLEEQYATLSRTAECIAQEIGCTGTAVQQSLKRFGIERRKGNQRWQDSLLHNEEWMIEQIKAKRSHTAIAAEIGCSRPTVATAIKKLSL